MRRYFKKNPQSWAPVPITIQAQAQVVVAIVKLFLASIIIWQELPKKNPKLVFESKKAWAWVVVAIAKLFSTLKVAQHGMLN